MIFSDLNEREEKFKHYKEKISNFICTFQWQIVELLRNNLIDKFKSSLIRYEDPVAYVWLCKIVACTDQSTEIFYV